MNASSLTNSIGIIKWAGDADIELAWVENAGGGDSELRGWVRLSDGYRAIETNGDPVFEGAAERFVDFWVHRRIFAATHQVQVRGDFAGATGDWRPAITGTLNQSGRSDAWASTFDSEEIANVAASLVADAGASPDDVRIVEVEAC